jgi:Outer membrane lipoprotein-sorting protein
MRAAALALGALMLLPKGAHSVDTHGVLAAARRRIESADYRLSGHLVHVNGNGVRTSDNVTIKALWLSGALHVLLEVTSPATARVHVLLEMRPGARSAIQIAHPGDAKPTELPFDKWNDGPLGEAFSYEDFLEAPFFWANQTALGEAKFGARSCDKVKSTPGSADRTHFAEVTSMLDHESSFPVYVEKTLKDSASVKEFTYFGLRRTQGVWSAKQVEAKIRGRAGSTLLIIDRGSAQAHLDLKDFTPAQLTRF